MSMDAAVAWFPMITHGELTSQMSMEVPYYSAKRVKLPSVCFHCGGNSGAVLANDVDIIELQNIHAVVRPICTFCKTPVRNKLHTVRSS